MLGYATPPTADFYGDLSMNMLKTSRWILLSAAWFTNAALAQVEPSSQVFDATGQPLATLESTMIQRGYKANRSAAGKQYWWNASEGRCISTRADNSKVVHSEAVQAQECTTAANERKDWRSIFGIR
jgi:hypothetical protein